MNMLKDIVNEFAVFSMPNREQLATGEDGNTQDQQSPPDDGEFSFGSQDTPPDGDADGSEDEDMDCECNCPSHQKKFGKSDDGSSIEDNDNIEIVDGDPQPDKDDGVPPFSLDDDEQDEDEESKFKLF